jgi:hypothetical protein
MATMVGEFELYNDVCQDEADIQKVIFWKRPNTDVEVTIIRPSWTDDTMVMSLADARKFYRQLQGYGFQTYAESMKPK